MRTTRFQLTRRSILLAAAALCEGLCRPPCPATSRSSSARDVPVDNMTFGELRKLLLGDRHFWSSNLSCDPVGARSRRY